MSGLPPRVYGTIGVGQLSAAANDNGGATTMQVTFSPSEAYDAPILGAYGQFYNPPAGTDAVVVFLNGDRNKPVVIATGHQQLRPKGSPSGASGLYDSNSSTITLMADGSIVISSASEVAHKTPLVRATGNLTVGTGASGTFPTSSGLTVTVQDGIITNIF